MVGPTTTTPPPPPAQPAKVSGKAHVKDICFTRMYITGHFDAPFEDYRLDAAVGDLVQGTGVPRAALMPLTCFIFKGYLWTLNNRRLWALRQAFVFTGTDEEVDVSILPESSFPERKDYVARLPPHKQEALLSPRFDPVIHGDQPKLQRLLLRPVRFRYDSAVRNGYRLLPGDRLLCINYAEAQSIFRSESSRASAPPRTLLALPAPLAVRTGTAAPRGEQEEGGESDDETESVTSEVPSLAASLRSGGSFDFPGRVSLSPQDLQRRVESIQARFGGGAGASAATGAGTRALAGTGTLPPLEEAPQGAEEEGGSVGRSSAKKAPELREVAGKFKEAVAGLRAVLDGLDAALDKLAPAISV